MSIDLYVVVVVPTPSPSPNPCAVRCSLSNKCIPSSKVCDFVNDCGTNDNSDEMNCGACDFESGKAVF